MAAHMNMELFLDYELSLYNLKTNIYHMSILCFKTHYYNFVLINNFASLKYDS